MTEEVETTENDQKYPKVYSNIFELTMSAYDFTFGFGRKTQKQIKAKSEDFERTVEVSMSPQHAKSVLVVLMEMIDKYEKEIGGIPVAPEFKERYDTLFNK